MQKLTVATDIRVTEHRAHDTNFFGIATANFMDPNGGLNKITNITGGQFDSFEKMIMSQKAKTFEQIVMAQAGTITVDTWDDIWQWDTPIQNRTQRKLVAWGEDYTMAPSNRTQKPGYGLGYIYLEFEGSPYDNNYVVTLSMPGQLGTAQILIEERYPSNGSTTVYKAVVWPNRPDEFLDVAFLDNPATRFSGGYSVRAAELSGPQGMLGMKAATAKLLTGGTKMRYDLHASNEFFLKRMKDNATSCKEVDLKWTDRESGKALNQKFFIDNVIWQMVEELNRMKGEAFMHGRTSIIDSKNPLSPFVKKHYLDPLSRTPLKTGSGFLELIAGSSYFKYSRVTVPYLAGLIDERFRGLIDDKTELNLKIVLAPEPFRELQADANMRYSGFLKGDSNANVGIVKGYGNGKYSVNEPIMVDMTSFFGFKVEVEMSHTFENEYNVLDMKDFIMILDYSPVTIGGRKFESNINKIKATMEEDSYYYVPGARDMFSGQKGSPQGPVPVASTKDGTDFGVLTGTGAACLRPQTIMFGTRAIYSGLR